MWIYVPDTDERKEPWIGKISSDESPKSSWTFELIRHADLENMYQTSPFDKKGTVIGLLDHQRNCTLIRPLVHHIDPGSLGVRIGFQRTRIEGQFGALLTDLSVSDSDECIFDGITFESDAFGAWYSSPAYKTNFDFETRTPSVQIHKTQHEKFEVSSLGRVGCTTGANLSSGVRSRVIKSVCIFQLEFDKLKSLNTSMQVCFGLERLFGFLIGFRGKPPSFKLRKKEKYKVGEHELSQDGVLEIRGIDWKEGNVPHPMECIHRNRIGGASLQDILPKFIADQDDILTRIHAVEFSRFFSTNLNDRFSVVMPILESYVKRKFTGNDEASYIAHEKKFFDWVESSQNDEIVEFSKKHIEVKGRKSPSLKALLLRAIQSVNSAGFCFPEEMANRIQKRRGSVFHSAPQMSEQDVREFYEEIRAATGLLMLHTFIDLGVDISALAVNYIGLRDFRGFLVPPKRPAGSKMVSTKSHVAARPKARGETIEKVTKGRKEKRSVKPAATGVKKSKKTAKKSDS